MENYTIPFLKKWNIILDLVTHVYLYITFVVEMETYSFFLHENGGSEYVCFMLLTFWGSILVDLGELDSLFQKKTMKLQISFHDPDEKSLNWWDSVQFYINRKQCFCQLFIEVLFFVSFSAKWRI